MGLDITAYRKLTAVRPLTQEEIEDGEPDDSDLISLRHFNPHYADRAEGLPENTAFSFVDSMGFRAGSYGGYNEWRDELAKMVGHPSARHAWANGADGKPFFELIHFSDCEGIIGPKTSAKLAKDFADNQDMADAYSGQEIFWFKELYNKWREAFDMASDGGAVEFH